MDSPFADDLFPGFDTHVIETAAGIRLHLRNGGSGPPLLLLHGFPQTHVIWHRLAPALAQYFQLVMPDLRGYGDSSKPAGVPGHVNYSKRAMAQDMQALMARLGHPRYRVLAHDRGARVAHRLAADHPASVERLTLLDIAPTLAMYEGTDQAFARAYWHWFFLIQPAPLPERLLMADPASTLRDLMGRGPKGLGLYDPRAFAEYVRCLSLPGTAHAQCEDYRAGASIDLEHDRTDRDAGTRLAMPLQILWGRDGVVARCCDPMAEWRRVANDVTGEALPGGHYLPEECPQAVLNAALPFLLSASAGRTRMHTAP